MVATTLNSEPGALETEMKINKVTFEELDLAYNHTGNLPAYCGRIARHIDDGDTLLNKLFFDNSKASFMLWNFLLTEEERLKNARSERKFIVGTMKDLGTVPVMVYSIPDAIAFYPDGAWWIPCIMELSAGLLTIADKLGIDESFCPVRAMLGAFESGNHFPIPDLLISSTGAVCDDFSAIAQRLESMGYPIEWWEMPHIRTPDADEETFFLSNGRAVSASQKKYLVAEFKRLHKLLEDKTGKRVTDEMLTEGIRKSNNIRRLLNDLRHKVFKAESAPLPALEMLIAEMLSIHFCSDMNEAENVLRSLLQEVEDRIENNNIIASKNALKVFWVNPVADLRAMNILEDCGCRLCGSDFMFTHALDEIPENISPIDALALAAMSDPMTTDSASRAERIVKDIRIFGSEAVIISKIPGASHCAFEGGIIGDIIKRELNIPVTEIEVPPLIDGVMINIKTKIEVLREIATDI